MAGVWGVCVPRVEMVNMMKIVKIVWACGWGAGGIPPVKIVKMVKMVWACGWGVGSTPPVKMVKMV